MSPITMSDTSTASTDRPSPSPAIARTLTHPGRRVRTLAAAIALAIATFATPALQAHATDNAPADPGVRCAAKLGPGEYEFYLPGAKVTDVNGNKWVCGPDGQWFRDYSASIGTRPTVRSPLLQLRAQVGASSASATFR
jgi:hypothetical protein